MMFISEAKNILYIWGQFLTQVLKPGHLETLHLGIMGTRLLTNIYFKGHLLFKHYGYHRMHLWILFLLNMMNPTLKVHLKHLLQIIMGTTRGLLLLNIKL